MKPTNEGTLDAKKFDACVKAIFKDQLEPPKVVAGDDEPLVDSKAPKMEKEVVDDMATSASKIAKAAFEVLASLALCCRCCLRPDSASALRSAPQKHDIYIFLFRTRYQQRINESTFMPSVRTIRKVTSTQTVTFSASGKISTRISRHEMRMKMLMVWNPNRPSRRRLRFPSWVCRQI